MITLAQMRKEVSPFGVGKQVASRRFRPNWVTILPHVRDHCNGYDIECRTLTLFKVFNSFAMYF